MAEVMLDLRIEPEEAAARFDAALARRRWTKLEGFAATWTCYFDAAFVEQVLRIVTDDVRGAAAEAAVERWHGVGSVAAIEPTVVTSSDAGAPARAPCEVWADGASPVGPLGEVVCTLHRDSEALGAALAARHWVRLEGLPRTWMHPFDLGMFAPIDAIVRSELAQAARAADVAHWRAAWSLATWGHVAVRSPDVEPGPYADWRW